MSGPALRRSAAPRPPAMPSGRPRPRGRRGLGAPSHADAKSGERLPPARDLATVLGVNTNTVLRSLRLLQDERLLELLRRRGITVAGTPEPGAVMQKVRELVEFARGQGNAVDELVEMIENVG